MLVYCFFFFTLPFVHSLLLVFFVVFSHVEINLLKKMWYQLLVELCFYEVQNIVLTTYFCHTNGKWELHINTIMTGLYVIKILFPQNILL